MSTNIFSKRTREKKIVCGRHVVYQPLAGMSNSGPFEYMVITEGNDYIILPNTRATGKLRIRKTIDGKTENITSIKQVGLVNLGPAALFKQIDVTVNGTNVSDNSSNTYPYKHMSDVMFNYGKESKESHLFNSLWVPDDDGEIDNFTQDNKGYMKRKMRLVQRRY